MATAAADVTVGEARPTTHKLTLVPLIALVVGSMIGGGVFNLPSDMSRGASPGAIIIGWVITGIGMLMLAFVYQGLAVRKPDLNAGPYAYAKAGFGDFVGFNSAWGYWISAFLGNVAYAVAIFSALSYFFPFFGDGNNLPSIFGASICLWLIHALVLQGRQGGGVHQRRHDHRQARADLPVHPARASSPSTTTSSPSTSGAWPMRRARAASARCSTR